MYINNIRHLINQGDINYNENLNENLNDYLQGYNIIHNIPLYLF